MAIIKVRTQKYDLRSAYLEIELHGQTEAEHKRLALLAERAWVDGDFDIENGLPVLCVSVVKGDLEPDDLEETEPLPKPEISAASNDLIPPEPEPELEPVAGIIEPESPPSE